jgi:hypothetical protein
MSRVCAFTAETTGGRPPVVAPPKGGTVTPPAYDLARLNELMPPRRLRLDALGADPLGDGRSLRRAPHAARRVARACRGELGTAYGDLMPSPRTAGRFVAGALEWAALEPR